MNDSANVPMLVWGDVFCSSLENILNNNYSDKDVQRRIGFIKKKVSRLCCSFMYLRLKLY